MDLGRSDRVSAPTRAGLRRCRSLRSRCTPCRASAQLRTYGRQLTLTLDLLVNKDIHKFNDTQVTDLRRGTYEETSLVEFSLY